MAVPTAGKCLLSHVLVPPIADRSILVMVASFSPQSACGKDLQEGHGRMSHENMDYEGVLHAAGHRVTPQRLMILDAVCDGAGHTTLKEVAARVQQMDDTIDLSSVYRTLKLFVELGLVISAETPAGET